MKKDQATQTPNNTPPRVANRPPTPFRAAPTPVTSNLTEDKLNEIVKDALKILDDDDF